VRVITGLAKGRRLTLPRGVDLRPTSGRIKESIFNIIGPWLEGERVLDLFAGIGSLGIEALSRGASEACFVEQNARVVASLRKNLELCGFVERSEIMEMNVDRGLRFLHHRRAAFELIFIDPPYGRRLLKHTLRELERARVLAEGGLIVAEHAREELLPPRLGGLELTDQRFYGRTVVSFLRWT